MKRIVSTEFSLGSIRADYSALGHGLDIMPFLGWTAEEIRRFEKRQRAEEKTRATRTLEEEQQRQERDHVEPPSTYDEVLISPGPQHMSLSKSCWEHNALSRRTFASAARC